MIDLERPQQPCGILNVNKPIGITSRDSVNRLMKAFRGMKVGHAGTLDPLASGVLIVCVGAASRLIEYVQRMPKTYRSVFRLGARSDTLDADGRIVEEIQPSIPDEEAVAEVLAEQVGERNQVPPRFSALKVGGRRAYDLARAGYEVDLAARRVTIHRIALIGFEWPRLEVEIECGSGTYIRSIARDVGEALGCGALVEVLTRTRIGPFTLADAITLESLTDAAFAGLLRPAIEAVDALPALRMTRDEGSEVVQGRSLELGRFADLIPDGEVALLGPDGVLVAIAHLDRPQGRIFPRRVLVATQSDRPAKPKISE